MNYETPKRSSNNPDKNTFSPVILRVSPASSSQKNLTGPPRVAKDIIADVYNTIQYWNDHHIVGAKIAKEIVSLRQNTNVKYSKEIEKLIENLSLEVESLKIYVKSLEIALSQISSLQKLNPEAILFISHSTDDLYRFISNIYTDYNNELRVKNQVLENIGHCRGVNEAMFYAALWTYQCNITDSTNLKIEALVVESGHKKFS